LPSWTAKSRQIRKASDTLPFYGPPRVRGSELNDRRFQRSVNMLPGWPQRRMHVERDNAPRVPSRGQTPPESSCSSSGVGGSGLTSFSRQRSPPGPHSGYKTVHVLGTPSETCRRNFPRIHCATGNIGSM
jgi:hypothetical protein